MKGLWGETHSRRVLPKIGKYNAHTVVLEFTWAEHKVLFLCSAWVAYSQQQVHEIVQFWVTLNLESSHSRTFPSLLHPLSYSNSPLVLPLLYSYPIPPNPSPILAHSPCWFHSPTTRTCHPRLTSSHLVLVLPSSPPSPNPSPNGSQYHLPTIPALAGIDFLLIIFHQLTLPSPSPLPMEIHPPLFILCSASIYYPPVIYLSTPSLPLTYLSPFDHHSHPSLIQQSPMALVPPPPLSPLHWLSPLSTSVLMQGFDKKCQQLLSPERSFTV